ncbi:MAG: hypothetical protein AVDCRST_MAG02-1404, partial [uncultured Rubrobacteraceae bacterium]
GGEGNSRDTQALAEDGRGVGAGGPRRPDVPGAGRAHFVGVGPRAGPPDLPLRHARRPGRLPTGYLPLQEALGWFRPREDRRALRGACLGLCDRLRRHGPRRHPALPHRRGRQRGDHDLRPGPGVPGRRAGRPGTGRGQAATAITGFEPQGRRRGLWNGGRVVRAALRALPADRVRRRAPDPDPRRM